MSHHETQMFKHLDKREMDLGLRLHHLATDTPSQLSDAFRAGADWALARLSPQKPETQHSLYKTGDRDVPESITDRNNEVVLSLCRNCGRAEAELSGPCRHRPSVYLCIRDDPEQRPTQLPEDVDRAIAMCDAAVERWGVVSVVSASLGFESHFRDGLARKEGFLRSLRASLEIYYGDHP